VTKVVFSAEAADFRDDVLAALCRDTFAVSLVDQSGLRFGAVLVSHNGTTIIYERWDDGAEAPSGEPTSIDIADVSEIFVY
jgi:hypothetical protein